ncbi:hypothetical protein ACFVT8_21690 [Lysinibacillus sp. NPDC058147]|uniref:hypothetical protein n=1 Tax=unclassified Lysinibacillus TaxID=2636778 RepID=UPI0036DD2C72
MELGDFFEASDEQLHPHSCHPTFSFIGTFSGVIAQLFSFIDKLSCFIVQLLIFITQLLNFIDIHLSNSKKDLTVLHKKYRATSY